MLCITRATSAGGFAFVGACDRTKGCLGMAPLPPSGLGAPFGTGVLLQSINCSWPLAHCACGPPGQMVWAAVLKGTLCMHIKVGCTYSRHGSCASLALLDVLHNLLVVPIASGLLRF